jgi:hypothetical protein
VLSSAAPEHGELFLHWSPARKAFIHTGIITDVGPRTSRMNGSAQYECRTIEGNITPTGRPEGSEMGRVSRFLSPACGDRSIRWTDLEERAIATRSTMTSRMHSELERELRSAFGSAA